MIDALADAVADAVAIASLERVFLAAALAGLVRGFSGFGTAMIFLPIASAALPPVWVLTTLMVMDLIGPIVLVRRILPQADRRDLALLGISAGLMLPIGVALLLAIPDTSFRYAVSIVTFTFLALLVFGFRLRTAPRPASLCLVGGLGGLLGGAVGVPGPPVMLLYLASTAHAASIRANIFIYLLLTEFMLLATFAVRDVLELTPIIIGAAAAIPYLLAMRLGAHLFDPSRERTYRVIAYLIIAASAFGGLPFLGTIMAR